MYLAIIFGIVGILWARKEGKESNPFNWDAAVGTFFTFIVLYFITLGVGRGIHGSNEKEYRDLPISSLTNKDGFSVSGGFILGTGGVYGSNYTYYVTYGNFNQGLKRLELGTENYYIKETNSKKPCIEKYWYINTKPAYESKWWWNRKSKRDEYMTKNYNAKTIIVPLNTVYKEFNVRD